MINKIVFGCLFTLSFLMIPRTCFSQDEEKHEIRLLAKPLADSVMLRWAPTSYRLWITGNQYGYMVSRTLIYKNGSLLKVVKPEMLTQLPLKPVELPLWEKLADREDMAGVAAQAIYGDDFDLDAGAKGSSISMKFQKASAQQSRMGFALLAADRSIDVAIYSGLYFADKKAVKGEKYVYKVYPASLPQDMKVDTAYFYTGIDEFMPLVAPANLKALPDDKMVTLTWEKLAQAGLFTGFYVERSDDGGKSFKPRNTAPLINTTPDGRDEVPFYYFMDSLANNATTYQYRIKGITPFGEMSPYSASVSVKGKNIIMAAPPISRLYSPDNVSVCVEWEIPMRMNTKSTYVRVLRSKSYDGTFITVGDSLMPEDLKYTDKHPLMTAYYKMQAFNSDGVGPAGSARLVQLVDSIPPLPPTGLKAIADTTGKVVLLWSKNSEPDMYGYRIFRANSRSEEFSQLTSKPLPDTVYVDNIELRTLTKKVFYQVVAIDKRQNRSVFSQILEVSRPDVVPPTTPAFRRAESVDNGALLSWYPSSSNDVTHHLLYRNTDGVEWGLLTQLGAIDSLYIDTTCVSQTLYRYKLVATDSTGNKSIPTQPVAVKYSKPIVHNLWITPTVKENKKKGVVELTWKANQLQCTRIFIYARNNSGLWVMVKGANNSGFETFMNPAQSYSEYQIKAVR